MTSAVLLLIFNRPDATASVMETLRSARPPRLYVAADGPRRSRDTDAERCDRAREVALSVDWPCTVETLFRDENLGCRRAVSEALSWFFAREEQGIVLEDDIIADDTFFTWCEEMLERYRDDERVMLISGYQPQRNSRSGDHAFFSRYGTIWGWASWARAWWHYDRSLALVDDRKRARRALYGALGSRIQAADKLFLSRQAHRGSVDSWAYSWAFARTVNSGLALMPPRSLTTNIGFEMEATHTRSLRAGRRPGFRGASAGTPIAAPDFVCVDRSYDNAYFRRTRGWRIVLAPVRWLYRTLRDSMPKRRR